MTMVAANEGGEINVFYSRRANLYVSHPPRFLIGAKVWQTSMTPSSLRTGWDVNLISELTGLLMIDRKFT
jgi:hypothetical protein